MSKTPIEPLVEATKTASVHFAKAAFEVASGVGALFTGMVRVVKQESGDTASDGGGSQKVTVE